MTESGPLTGMITPGVMADTETGQMPTRRMITFVVLLVTPSAVLLMGLSF